MKKIWILIHVSRGFIQEPEIFFDQKAVDNRQTEILKDFDPAYDEVEIFIKYIS